MSVINKMLKDLEHRDPEQGGEFQSNSAVYRPEQKSKLPLVLALMLLVILTLAAVVSWLLYDEQKSAAISDTVIARTAPVTPELAPVPATAEQIVSESTETKAVADKAQSHIIAQVQPESVAKTKQPLVASTDAVTQQIPEAVKAEPVAQAIVKKAAVELPNTAAKKQQVKADNVIAQPILLPKPEQLKLKIEKSSTRLTPEQRIASLMTKAQASFDKGYIADAITQLNELLAAADDHVEARNLLAVAWYGRGDLQQAIAVLNNGLNRYPNIEQWRLTAAKIFFKENQLVGAFSYLQTELAAASNEYYSMKASLARKLKRFDQAEQAYSQLTKLEPEQGNWWLGHAIALDSQGKRMPLSIVTIKLLTEGGSP